MIDVLKTAIAVVLYNEITDRIEEDLTFSGQVALVYLISSGIDLVTSKIK